MRLIQVAAPALSAHLRHGDTEPVESLELIPTDGATFSASRSYDSANGPDKAFDGLYAPGSETAWNSGQWPSPTNPQWIEIDFGSPQTFSEMKGHVGILPDGFGTWNVTFDGAPAFSWSEYLSAWQEISKPFPSDQTAQTVRLTTTGVGGSWAAWLEIQFFRTVVGC